MGGVRHLGWGMDHEAEPVHGRADHRDFARAGGWGKDGRRLPQAREATAVLADWRHEYNTVRPHSALGNPPPAEYADRRAPEKQRHGAQRYVEGSAPHPVAPPSRSGSNEVRILPIAG
jgi:putative transposase